MRKAKEKKYFCGFTLIELLVVVAVIGVLTSLIMVNFNAARSRARDLQRKSDLDQTKKALRMYYNDFEAYPSHDTDSKISALCGGATATTFDWGATFNCGEMVYIKALPEDPVPGSTYYYQQLTGGQDFCLWAELENKTDNDLTKSQSRCFGCSALLGIGDYVVCAD
jgi:type II secretion system protein G